MAGFFSGGAGSLSLLHEIANAIHAITTMARLTGFITKRFEARFVCNINKSGLKNEMMVYRSNKE
jgi:hypothetical protein